MNRRPRPWVIVLALALMAATLLLRLFVGDREEPGAVVFAPSVALFALELGAIPGVLAGLLATFLFYATVDDVRTWDLVLRGVSLVVLGALVGVLGSRLRLARATARTAAQINDNVIQGLALARYALDRRDVDEATVHVDETLRHAREIVEGLVEPTRVRPGDLRRDSAARVP